MASGSISAPMPLSNPMLVAADLGISKAAPRAGPLILGSLRQRPAGDTLSHVERCVLLLAPLQAAAEWRALRANHFYVVGDVSTSRLRAIAL